MNYNKLSKVVDSATSYKEISRYCKSWISLCKTSDEYWNLINAILNGLTEGAHDNQRVYEARHKDEYVDIATEYCKRIDDLAEALGD